MHGAAFVSRAPTAAARCATIVCLVAAVPGILAAEPALPRLRPGATAVYKLERESTLTLTINGREQKEGVSAGMELRADAGEADRQGVRPLKIAIRRVRAKAARFRSEWSFDTGNLDTGNLDASKPLGTSQFAPLAALAQQPLELLYVNGRLASVAGAADFASKLEELLKKDFQGSEEYEFAGPVYAALAADEALRASWKNVVVAELSAGAEAGEAWEEAEELRFVGDVPSETWLGLLQANVKTSSTMAEGSDGSLQIKSRFEAGSNDARKTRLGPNDFSYTVDEVAGTRELQVHADGLIRELNMTRTIKVSGKLEFGDGIPMEIRAATTLRVERAAAP